jgi:hypothetical protein
MHDGRCFELSLLASAQAFCLQPLVPVLRFRYTRHLFRNLVGLVLHRLEAGSTASSYCSGKAIPGWGRSDEFSISALL